MEEELNLEREFVVKPLALRMKLLGFDEPCIAHYRGYDLEPTPQLQVEFNTDKNSDFGDGDYWVSAPTWQSAFEWFREKYNCHSHPTKYDETKWWVGYGTWTSPVFDSFYEAQKCWLERIIELAEKIELDKK
jgi:hypothetical protein